MVLPLILAGAMIGGLAVSGGANLYSQYAQRKLYRKQAAAYKALDRGYDKYLEGHGRVQNPNRSWASYYGQYQKAKKGIEVSYANSVGTVGGTVGAGAAFSSKGIYGGQGKTSKWL